MSEVEDVVNLFYVYECRVDGVIRYIGMGKGNRYKHCYSGNSSCAELNKDFHAGKEITVDKVAQKLNKADATMLEWELINSNTGLYNKSKGGDFTSSPDYRKSSNYKTVASLYDKKTRPKLMKLLGSKAESLDDKSFEALRSALGGCGLEIYMVQYGTASPILLLDRSTVTNFEVNHLGCRNYPFCNVVGYCGEL